MGRRYLIVVLRQRRDVANTEQEQAETNTERRPEYVSYADGKV